MKKILAISLKDTLLRFTSPMEWAFFIIMPVFFIFMLSGGTGAPQDPRITFYVVDQARSELSELLFTELGRSSSVKPVAKEFDEAVSDLDARQVSAILIIPETFTSTALMTGSANVEFRQQPNNTNALIDLQALQVALDRISGGVDVAVKSTELAGSISPFDSDQSRQKYFEETLNLSHTLLSGSPSRIIEITGETEDLINYDPKANSVSGQMITWVFIPLIGLSAMFAMERQTGTLRRILVTPTSKTVYIGGTIFGQVVTAMIQMAILITFGWLFLKIDWGNSILALVMIIASSTLAAAALGTMLGTFVKTEGQANGLSIMIGMVMAMLGGCWYPIELFPEFMRSIARIFPTTWAMQGLLDISVRGQGAEGVLLETLVLLGFAAVFFVIGVWRFKYE
jgi:ABC-2 type transport system permease protein